MKFYRYEAVEYASIDYDGDYVMSSIPNPRVVLREYNMHRETPKGYWIGYGEARRLSSKGWWVSKTAKKRRAYPTKEEALNNFIKRTERRIKILSRQLDFCNFALRDAKRINTPII